MGILDVLSAKNNATIPEHYKNMSVEEMENRVSEIKEKFGERLFLPCHHYQKDEVVQFADATGDSLRLAQLAAENDKAEYIVFCGVHFMAETADMLTRDDQIVILPDMRAGCSMADMADMEQTERAWKVIQEVFGDTVLPVTYINSTAAIKAFCGRNGGATVTSSNAKKMIEWAFTQKERLLFLPDQHLGRNTCVDLGIPLEQMAVWDPINDKFEYDGDLEDVKVILWKGHCSVHESFTVENVEDIRRTKPDMNILVHPECSHEVVKESDYNGSTSYIIETIKKAPAGSKWAIGTEMNLVKRIIAEHSDKEIMSLNPNMCPCMTMNRIDLPHLLWALETIEQKEQFNQITVDQEIAKDALLALDKMLKIV